jgi:N6-L-threonylcarbamoyladenine synthase
MEELVKNSDSSNEKKGSLKFPIANKGGYFNLSGMESYMEKYHEERNHKKEDVFFSLFESIGKTISKSLIFLMNEFDVPDVLLTGGVASNSIIKEVVESEINKFGGTLYYASPRYSTDNAVGIAMLCAVNKG